MTWSRSARDFSALSMVTPCRLHHCSGSTLMYYRKWFDAYLSCNTSVLDILEINQTQTDWNLAGIWKLIYYFDVVFSKMRYGKFRADLMPLSTCRTPNTGALHLPRPASRTRMLPIYGIPMFTRQIETQKLRKYCVNHHDVLRSDLT